MEPTRKAFRPAASAARRSNQLHMSIGEDLLARVKEAAATRGITMKSFVVQAFEYALDNIEDLKDVGE